uniref:non-specific serine/threonine protein kinase n=1 Tax=Populus alba TaxID=43335 RepID=A0A4U5Q4H9_POPAL|nr:putative receptor-like protein kinase [Populus alba]
MASDLKKSLTKECIGMEFWVVIMVCLGLVCVFALFVSLWLSFRKKSRRSNNMLPISQIPKVPEEIKEIGIDQNSANNDGFLSLNDKFSDKESEKVLIQLENGDDSSQSGSLNHVEKDGVGSQSGEEGGTKVASANQPSSHPITAPSPMSGLPEFSQLGWGHWFTLRDLQVATNRFSKDNIIGDGGYGVVYQGHLINGTPVAVKKLLNNPGQADKDFRVEVEAIGHVRHKNLVRLLGYCMEGTQRMLVYEYVNNGNLEQWLHGGMRQHGYLTWEARMKILLGTAKAYVAPEYANSGLLNEKSDVYSFGVVLLEAITGRDPVDHGRPENEVNLVEWLKTMVARRRSEEVVDPMIETRPSTSALKRGLLTALRCVDPDADKRPKMSQVVRMLESEEYPMPRQDRRHRRGGAGEGESQMENSDTDRNENPDTKQ